MATGVQPKRWTATAFAAILLFGVAACGEESRGNSRDAAVETDADVGGFEGLLAELEDGVAGLPCNVDSDCAGTNGRCSPGTEGAVHSCTGLCDDDDQCGEGGTCVEVARLGTQTVSFCQKTCTDDSQCDEKLECSQSFNAYEVIVGISHALRGADVLEPSRTPTICQEKVDTVHLEDGAVGRPCQSDSECGGGTCNNFAAAFPNGYCSGKCFRDEQCGNTGGCLRDVASETLGLPGACFRECTDSSECRQDEGYGCWPLLFVFPQESSSYCMYEWPLGEGAEGFLLPGAGDTDATADAVAH
jgi:hypothetical protein